MEGYVSRLVFLVCSFISLAGIWAAPAYAAGTGSRQHETNWNQRDTAIYVVSTLNLVRTTGGRPFAQAVSSDMDVTHFDVYADLDRNGLYFIQLKRDDDSVAAVLAYQMGWLKPKSVTTVGHRFGLRPAAWPIVQAYKGDTKGFMQSFASTMPR